MVVLKNIDFHKIVFIAINSNRKENQSAFAANSLPAFIMPVNPIFATIYKKKHLGKTKVLL